MTTALTFDEPREMSEDLIIDAVNTHGKKPVALVTLGTALSTVQARKDFGYVRTDSQKLAYHESRIADGLKGTFGFVLRMGSSLEQIRKHKLYLLRFPTFEEYCQEVCHFTQMTASRYIRASALTKLLRKEGKWVPSTMQELLNLTKPKPRKKKVKPEPELEIPTDAAPVSEDPSHPTPTMLQNMMDLFANAGVDVWESATPGRWTLELTTDQARVCAQALGARSTN